MPLVVALAVRLMPPNRRFLGLQDTAVQGLGGRSIAQQPQPASVH
ncbi:hypothetical protein [Desulfobacca acetoxidans]|nr:hypothetical protein [Desulfobacca acetoxidans]